MRNQRWGLPRVLGATAALVAALAMINTAQAGAAVWAPTGSTATGSATNISFQSSSLFRCDQTAMTLKTAADGTLAMTQPASGGVTFGSCWATGFAGGLSTSVTMTGAWTVHPTSTTTATIAVPASSLKINVAAGGPLACTITVGAINIPATWSNVSRKLTPVGNTALPFTASPTGGYCGTSGVLLLNMGFGGWHFPTFSIV